LSSTSTPENCATAHALSSLTQSVWTTALLTSGLSGWWNGTGQLKSGFPEAADPPPTMWTTNTAFPVNTGKSVEWRIDLKPQSLIPLSLI